MGLTVSHTDKIASVLLLALAAAVFVVTADFPEGPTETSAAFFPRVIAILIAGFALFQLGKSIVDGTRQAHEVTWPVTKRVGVVGLLIVAYVLAMPRLGFVLATFLFLVVTMRYSGVFQYRWSLPLAAGLSVLLYYVFFEFLRVPLPTGDYVSVAELLPALPILVEWMQL